MFTQCLMYILFRVWDNDPLAHVARVWHARVSVSDLASLVSKHLKHSGDSWGIVKVMVPFWVPITIRSLIRGLF